MSARGGPGEDQPGPPDQPDQPENDRLDEASVARALHTCWLGRRHLHLPECTSTNDRATAEARAGADQGLLITADEQTRGRGRLGRTWHSPPGESLYLSMVLRPQRPPAEIPPVTLLAGAAIAEGLRQLGFAAEVKWPNDVLIAESGRAKKVAGVLTEAATEGDRIGHLVVGIGLNVNNERFPDELADRATSLRLVSGRPLARAHVLAAVLAPFETAYERFDAIGPEAAIEMWEHYAPLGRRYRATVGRQAIEGIATGVGADGALELRDDRGSVHRILAGEVVPIAPRGK